MTKLLKLTMAAVLLLGVASTTASADARKGQKIFIKKFKSKCGFNGAKFAAKHSQGEWSSINEAGNFKQEMMVICPDVKESDIKDSWVPHLYDFSYEYANDSGNVPSC
ncbi:cytochrome C [Arcobacter sp. CECT 8989]|uniref:cytochrome C n=1 Tax=Arcobacter sp. CECT 8989 TaxID=2044509 RepID=UPI00100B3895|nr:cytochrome C [Arcobacter sp. CECT 8989]RXK02246.1 cytochrome C [Arcobacter sp. CECT 8989]